MPAKEGLALGGSLYSSFSPGSVSFVEFLIVGVLFGAIVFFLETGSFLVGDAAAVTLASLCAKVAVLFGGAFDTVL